MNREVEDRPSLKMAAHFRLNRVTLNTTSNLGKRQAFF